MTLMTVERLHDLLDNQPDQSPLAWPGTCHDCQKTIRVTATPMSDGIHIAGGCVYEPMHNQFFLKCDDCFEMDPVLRNYQGCEVYSRVVGYLRPVAQWNDAKTAEFDNRRTFDSCLT